MKEKDQMLVTLRTLALDRTAVAIMREDLTRIDEDLKRELPDMQREALDKERIQLQSCLSVTEHRIERVERIMSLLMPDEREVLERMIVDPYPEVVFDLAEELGCETSRVYRIRARALSKLVRLRYGAGE